MARFTSSAPSEVLNDLKPRVSKVAVTRPGERAGVDAEARLITDAGNVTEEPEEGRGAPECRGACGVASDVQRSGDNALVCCRQRAGLLKHRTKTARIQ